MFISCKQQEIYYPQIYELIDITDGAYVKDELIEMESHVLKVLNFNILSPTANDFYNIIAKAFNFDKKQYFFVKIRFLYMVYIYGGLILYCIFLLYDLQLILGRGERKYRDDDYILAALNIFIDIINLFVRILWILGNYCKFK